MPAPRSKWKNISYYVGKNIVIVTYHGDVMMGILEYDHDKKKYHIGDNYFKNREVLCRRIAKLPKVKKSLMETKEQACQRKRRVSSCEECCRHDYCKGLVEEPFNTNKYDFFLYHKL